MNRPLLPFALGLLALTAPAAALEVRATAAATFADNLSRTSAVATQKDAAVYSGNVTILAGRPLAPGWTLSLEGEADLEHVPEFRALDRAQAAVHVGLRRKLGLGPLAPWMKAQATLGQARFDEDHRSGTLLAGSVTAGKRFTETLQASAGGEIREYAAKLHPFDVRQRRLFAEASWDATTRWRLSGGGARQWGEITANAAWPIYGTALGGGFGPAIQSYYSSIPWATTGTFGPGWVAYRVDARTDSWWLALSPALTDRTTLTLRYESVRVVNRVQVRYDSEFWSLSVIHRL